MRSSLFAFVAFPAENRPSRLQPTWALNSDSTSAFASSGTLVGVGHVHQRGRADLIGESFREQSSSGTFSPDPSAAFLNCRIPRQLLEGGENIFPDAQVSIGIDGFDRTRPRRYQEPLFRLIADKNS
jgi:hypothetical protein